jgi:predicted dehydrogenase
MGVRRLEARPLGVGVVGTGTVSARYLENMSGSPLLEVVACSDAVPDRARERAEQYGVPRVLRAEELLADPDVELVVNLTVPAAHAAITLAALRAGKHVWSEKPLATTREEGREILREARARGLQVGCAPDTTLGAGLQTVQRLIERGAVGLPLAATACFMTRGPDEWHPDPAFFFQAGAGPLLDVGPYSLTTLVTLLGPVRRVTASGRVLYGERTVAQGPKRGETFVVKTPTLVAGVLEHVGGQVSTLLTAFGAWGGTQPHVEVFGSEGVLDGPDPNTFEGPVRLREHASGGEWREVPLAYHHTDGCRNCRGIGVAEMAQAIRAGRAPRASGALAYHVLDVMLALDESAVEGRHVVVTSTCRQPRLLPLRTALLAPGGPKSPHPPGGRAHSTAGGRPRQPSL